MPVVVLVHIPGNNPALNLIQMLRSIIESISFTNRAHGHGVWSAGSSLRLDPARVESGVRRVFRIPHQDKHWTDVQINSNLNQLVSEHFSNSFPLRTRSWFFWCNPWHFQWITLAQVLRWQLRAILAIKPLKLSSRYVLYLEGFPLERLRCMRWNMKWHLGVPEPPAFSKNAKNRE